MGYLGNDLKVAYSTYKNIDDISGSFNGSTTSFSLLVGGVAPSPLPLNSQQCLISVGGVVQRPDDTGAEGFRLSGGNIVFSSAPGTGEDFFGVILAGADYVNVGANFPSGSAAVPSITFDSDLDTGIYNSAANQVSITTAGTERLRIDSAGQIESVSLGSASAPAFSFTTDPNTGIYSPGTDQVAISTNGTGRLFVDSNGRIGVGTASPTATLHIAGTTGITQALTAGEDALKGLVNIGTVGTSGGSLVVRTAGVNANEASGLGIDGTYSHPVSTINIKAFSAASASYSSQITFQTQSNSASPAERMRIDSSGRFLVGTSSSTNASANCKLVVNTQSSSVRLEGTGGYGIDCIYTTVPASGDDLGYFNFKGYTTGTTEVSGGWLLGEADGAWSSGSAPTRLTLWTCASGASSPTERMRIPQNGFTRFSNTGTYTSINASAHGFRTDASDWVIDNVNANASPYGLKVRYTAASPNNTSQQFFQCEDSTTVRAEIRSNGGLANFSANNANLSDRNAKKDISPAAGTWDCVKEWEIVNYRYKDQPDDADLNVGVIAQQVAESCPEVITVFEEAKDDQPEKLGIKEQQMYWMAIKALQEAQVRIEALEAEVAALKAQ